MAVGGGGLGVFAAGFGGGGVGGGAGGTIFQGSVSLPIPNTPIFFYQFSSIWDIGFFEGIFINFCTLVSIFGIVIWLFPQAG